MQCPFCKCNETKIYTSNPPWSKDKSIVKRYRRCENCGRSFATIERYVEVKRGRRRKNEQAAAGKVLQKQI